jgi:hypothetical protein
MKDALINNEYLDEIDLSCKYFLKYNKNNSQSNLW